MKILSACVIFVAFIGASLAAIDVCSKDICDGKHIACGHSGEFHSRCPKGAVLVNIDKKLQQVMLDNFNEKRNFLAGGGEPNLRPACRMATVEWDDELAYLATLQLKQCEFEHTCQSTEKFEYPGQSLYGGYASGEMDKLEQIDHVAELQNPMKAWYEEIAVTNARIVRHIGEAWLTAGHFLVMMNDGNFRVGCGASMYEKPDVPGYVGYYVTCNFARTNTDQTYADCDVPAKDCTTGTNPKFPNLCSTAEVFDSSPF